MTPRPQRPHTILYQGIMYVEFFKGLDFVVGSPFSFWSAGTDNGVPDGPPRGRLGPFVLTLAALLLVVILLALFVHR